MPPPAPPRPPLPTSASTDDADAPGPAICVVDEAGPLTGRGLLAELAYRGAETWLLGGGGLRTAAQQVGLDPPIGRFLAVPTGHARWAGVRLRPWVERAHQAQGWECWSLPTAVALRRAGARGPILLHLRSAPTPGEVRRLNRRPVVGLKLATSGPGLADAWLAAGLTGYALLHEPPATPPATVSSASADSRTQLREHWGVADPPLPAVLLLSDTPGQGDTYPAAMTVNLTAEASGQDLRLLIHPEQRGRSRVQHLQDAMGVGQRLVQEPAVERPWQLLHAVDAALLGESPAPRAAAAALAAGVPIVGPDLPWHRDTLQPGAGVYLTPTAEPKKLADRLQHAALRLPGLPRTQRDLAHGPITV